MSESRERATYHISVPLALHAQLTLALRPYGMTTEQAFQNAPHLLLLIARGELSDREGHKVEFGDDGVPVRKDARCAGCSELMDQCQTPYECATQRRITDA